VEGVVVVAEVTGAIPLPPPPLHAPRKYAESPEPCRPTQTIDHVDLHNFGGALSPFSFLDVTKESN